METSLGDEIGELRRRRILVLTPQLWGTDGVSGVSRLVVQACRDAIAEDGTVEVWSLARSPGDTGGAFESGGNQRSAGGNRLRFASWGLSAATVDRSDTVVVVLHAHLAPIALPVVRRGARAALFLHGVEVWRRLGVLEAMLVRRAAILVANSRHTAERFKAANPKFERREIAICPLGIPLSVGPAPAQMPATGGPRSFALIVGRMSAEERYKGHDLLLEIWPELLRSVPQASLVVVGDGDDRARLQGKARALGLDGTVRFTGWVPDGVLNRLYRDCAFFLMPSRDEGFGLVFLEAMRAEKACIGGRGAAEEVIEDGRTGLIVDPKDRDALLRSVRLLFEDPDRRDAMGRAGLERVARHFTQGQFTERFRRLLHLEGDPACAA